MSLDRGFAEALIAAMTEAGWNVPLPKGELPNPLTLNFRSQEMGRRLIIHARRITPQSRPDENPSDHHRPAGEMHTQMIFDGDRRGAGHKNSLRFERGAETVLFGFQRTPEGYVVAAYDPDKHRTYSYSKSLQVKKQTLDVALREGIAFQQRESNEMIVAFHINEVAQYLTQAHELHNLIPDADVAAPEEEILTPVRKILERTLDERPLPQLVASERKRRFSEIARNIRDHAFKQGIARIYEHCAICGFQYDYVLEAAHIVPVAEGGTDTYGNGLGLCPNCHSMYDRGFILVNEDFRIYINPRYAEEYDQIGRAGSLETLRHTLRESLWLPDDEQFWPSSENLRRTFEKRR